MSLICPKCRQTIPFDVEEPPKELVCSSCGTVLIGATEELVTLNQKDCDETITYVSNQPADTAPESGKPGSPRFGDYELLDEVARGGMGVVFKARQVSLNRVVALKMIKTGQFASDEEVQRFHSEAEAAAQLDHPNIVPIYEVGQQHGQQYYSMGFVAGKSLQDRLNDEPLPPREAALLIKTLADAMCYAHNNGILHRDLKPANVLIDADGNPRITDFGLAKKIADDSGITATGQVIGTPSFMPPEQAAGRVEDLGRPADVYSLGAMLYATLTGRPPFQAASVMETLKQVLEREPVAPRQLNPDVDKDLETICLKCLEKDSNLRYSTADDLAAELGRYLEGTPILARPIGNVARVWRWCRRNPAMAMVATVAVVLLITLSIGGPWMALRQSRLYLDAEEQRESAAQSAEAEKTAKLQAQKRLKQIEKANEILGSIFENLDPNEVANADRPLQAVLVENLDRAVRDLEGEAIGDPVVVAVLQNKLGLSLLRLGEAKKAIILLEKALPTLKKVLGDDDPKTLVNMNNLAIAYENDGNWDKAIPLFERTLRIRRRVLGNDHPHTLTSMGALAAAYGQTDKPEQAMPLLEETLRRRKATLGPEDPATLTSMANLATAHFTFGDKTLAIPLHKEVFELRKKVLRKDHPDMLTSMTNLATAYGASGKTHLAIPLLKKVLELRKSKFKDDHPDTLDVMNTLAVAYMSSGRFDQSIPLFEDVLSRRRKSLGNDRFQTVRTAAMLGVNYVSAGQPLKALDKLREAHRASRKHRSLQWVSDELLKVYVKLQMRKEASSLVDELVRNARAQAPPTSARLGVRLSFLNKTLVDIGAFAEAETILRKCLALHEMAQPDSWFTFNAQFMLGTALLGRKNYTEAEMFLKNGFEGMKRREATGPADAAVRLTESLKQVIELYKTMKKPVEASMWREKKEAYRRNRAQKN